MEVPEVDSDAASALLDGIRQEDEWCVEFYVQFHSVSCFLTFSDGCGLQGERERERMDRVRERERKRKGEGDNTEKKGERKWPKEECGEREKMGE